MLKEMIEEFKQKLNSPDLPFGVDLLIPQLGSSARKTNVDYTRGTLNDLITVIIEGGAKLFVSAVGVAPKRVVDRLHAAGILYINIVGHPKHVHKACAIGADLICAKVARRAATLATFHSACSSPHAPIYARSTGLR